MQACWRRALGCLVMAVVIIWILPGKIVAQPVINSGEVEVTGEVPGQSSPTGAENPQDSTEDSQRGDTFNTEAESASYLRLGLRALLIALLIAVLTYILGLWHGYRTAKKRFLIT